MGVSPFTTFLIFKIDKCPSKDVDMTEETWFWCIGKFDPSPQNEVLEGSIKTHVEILIISHFKILENRTQVVLFGGIYVNHIQIGIISMLSLYLTDSLLLTLLKFPNHFFINLQV